MLILTQENGIHIYSLNRPEKRNALDGQLVKALQDALSQSIQDEAVRVIVLKGEGADFCAGADIAWMQKIAVETPAENLKDAIDLANLMYTLYHSKKPIIVLAQGISLGGGMGLIAAADVVIASDQASFGFSEIQLGLAPAIISPYVLKAIGPRAAQYYFLSGERFDASEAKHLGLVHKILPAEDLWEGAMQFARRIADWSVDAVWTIKEVIQTVDNEKLSPELREKTAEHLARLRSGKGAKEGLQAFLEKRKPHWS